jgi:hypothetical protein
MTLFEYVTVAVSIVLSFGLVRLLDGVRPALARGRVYRVHAMWVAIKLLNHVVLWWALWNYRDAVAWNLARFAWVLLPPALLYLQATALVTRAPQDVADWKDHFFEIRRWFFTINVVLVSVSSIGSYMIGGVPLTHPLRPIQGLLLAASLLGLASEDERLHTFVALASLLLVVLGFGGVFFRASALALG